MCLQAGGQDGSGLPATAVHPQRHRVSHEPNQVDSVEVRHNSRHLPNQRINRHHERANNRLLRLSESAVYAHEGKRRRVLRSGQHPATRKWSVSLWRSGMFYMTLSDYLRQLVRFIRLGLVSQRPCSLLKLDFLTNARIFCCMH